MSSFKFVILIEFLVLINLFEKFNYSYGDETFTAILTISSKIDEKNSSILLVDSGIYASNSQLNKIDGQLIYAQSYKQDFLNKILNKSDTDNKGCSTYANENLPFKYVAIVERSECLFNDQINYAIQSKASALLIINTNQSELFAIKTGTNYSLVVVLISFQSGQKILSLLKDVNLVASIMPNYSSNFQQSDSTQQTSLSNRLSSTSILFIVIGILSLVLILTGMCIVFYVLQRSRRVDERERMAKLIAKLTRKAVTNMKCQKLRPQDKELVSNEMCVICMENFKVDDVVRKLPCLHYFHKSEIDIWLYENKSCPICKIDILKNYCVELESKQNIVDLVLQRVGLVQSPEELNRIVSDNHNRRRDTLYSVQSSRRYSMYSTLTDTTTRNLVPSNTVEQRNSIFSDFKINHLRSFSLDNLDENDDETKPSQVKRLTFFGEQFHQQPSELKTDKPKIPLNATNKIEIIIQEDNSNEHSQLEHKISSAPSQLVKIPSSDAIESSTEIRSSILNNETSENDKNSLEQHPTKFT